MLGDPCSMYVENTFIILCMIRNNRLTDSVGILRPICLIYSFIKQNIIRKPDKIYHECIHKGFISIIFTIFVCAMEKIYLYQMWCTMCTKMF